MGTRDLAPVVAGVAVRAGPLQTLRFPSIDSMGSGRQKAAPPPVGAEGVAEGELPPPLGALVVAEGELALPVGAGALVFSEGVLPPPLGALSFAAGALIGLPLASRATQRPHLFVTFCPFVCPAELSPTNVNSGWPFTISWASLTVTAGQIARQPSVQVWWAAESPTSSYTVRPDAFTSTVPIAVDIVFGTPAAPATAGWLCWELAAAGWLCEVLAAPAAAGWLCGVLEALTAARLGGMLEAAAAD